MPAEARVERGQQEQIQQRARDQATEDDEGHGTLDFVAGDVAFEHERQQRERGRGARS